ncbi:MAG: hypothetical protein HLUCCA12_00760 [Rhodobacteraceae bacterium HLUCCA12]|nr:MAG: hypothetical protein HLUCCA12_00760 [Rhodobacteraceae bacterium HLUCCA12]
MPSAAPHDPDDPKGLIRESYRIEGIGDGECRSILIDWALSIEASRDQAEALARLHARYGPQAPDHPMTRLMAQTAGAPTAPAGRRGGRAGRLGRT